MFVCIYYQLTERIIESETIGTERDCVSKEYWCSHEHSSWPEPGHAIGIPPCKGSVEQCSIPPDLRGELESVEND